jgi:hypothetical protein
MNVWHSCIKSLPSGLGDDHLRAQLMELIPELCCFQMALDLAQLRARGEAVGRRLEALPFQVPVRTR